MAEIKRETANICLIEELNKGDYIKAEGWKPSYIQTQRGNFSRVNIIGVIINTQLKGAVIEDQSGKILLRNFENEFFSNFESGDLVLVIGRPRIYNEEKYLLCEIIRKIEPKWAAYRKIQLQKYKEKVPYQEKKETKPQRVTIKEEKPKNDFQIIMEFIKDLDDGSGAQIEEIIKRSQIKDAEILIQKLIEEGEIFEIKSGKVKILD